MSSFIFALPFFALLGCIWRDFSVFVHITYVVHRERPKAISHHVCFHLEFILLVVGEPSTLPRGSAMHIIPWLCFPEKDLGGPYYRSPFFLGGLFKPVLLLLARPTLGPYRDGQSGGEIS